MEIVGTGSAENILEEVSLSEALGNVSPNAVVAVDAHQCVTTFTPEAEALTQLPAEQILHQPFTSLPSGLQDAIRETFDSGEAVRNRHITLTGGKRRAAMLRVNTTPLRNGGPHLNGVVAVLNDVSATNKFLGKMRQLDRLASIGTLSASMAHEIKNALVPVRTFVDLLLQKNQDADLAEIVIREMRRVESIVSQMLKFAGPAKPTFATIHIHEVIAQALQLVHHQLEGRKLNLQRAFDAYPDTVRGDAYQLEQAFLNLFFNAIDAMGPHGNLHVATRIVPAEDAPAVNGYAAPDGWLEIVVSDTGTGVPPEDVDRLFEPFFTTKPNGTGLGLTITRRIIKEHYGTVQVDTRLNHGTTFTIMFPAVPPANGNGSAGNGLAGNGS